MVAVLLSSYSPSSSPGTGEWVTSKLSGLPAGRKIRAYSYAHPTTFPIALAERCRLGRVPLVLGLSYGDDAICRFGLGQVQELRRMFGKLTRLRRSLFGAKWRDVGEKEETYSHFHILEIWWRWRKLRSRNKGDDLSEQEKTELSNLENEAWKIRRKIYTRSTPKESLMIPPGKMFHIDRVEVTDSRAKQNSCDSDEDEDPPVYLGLYEVNDPSQYYSIPWFSSTCISDHLPLNYLGEYGLLN
jgi:hypothetical protein